ncbi:hypothetical protein PAXRUDRAFT_22857 [Paxillus rubicundulus Ve08.2h10]|uniref:Uncharacterized protein n=1 Tax=Paxillus rubicundulus Ve08.2h10 TaxID=930991 RepID=A0A0D0D4K6_9AGAM|nr:hypothetical protein PAXRUDRAFT_22857 [Paxillus rubicundulus Ve08.2h10]
MASTSRRPSSRMFLLPSVQRRFSTSKIASGTTSVTLAMSVMSVPPRASPSCSASPPQPLVVIL